MKQYLDFCEHHAGRRLEGRPDWHWNTIDI
ncbi:hypothetical protein R7V76_13825 [Exiguobacterium sibiricum]|nr:hypothetical protein [Exiguobacterium sibiricum]MDW2886673.1 hypothetical protein [Exiguobacterium sibiricum]